MSSPEPQYVRFGPLPRSRFSFDTLTAKRLAGVSVYEDRDGKSMNKEEYLAHEAEDGPDGECPVCRERPIHIKAGGWSGE